MSRLACWAHSAFVAVDRAAPPLLAPASVLALLAGALALQLSPGLPSPWLLATGCVAALLLCRWPLLRWPALCLLGACWFGLRADLALAQRLPHELEGADMDVQLRVLDLPDARADAVRFDALIESASYQGRLLPLHGRLRLSWFGAAPLLRACGRWQLQLRLKRPRGASNPGGFDLERHALQLGLVATGYVREDAGNRELATSGFCVDGLRERIAAAIAVQFGDSAAAHLLRALAVGDQRGLSDEEWQVLRATGVGHLIAISGLHVSMLGLVGAWCARRLWRLWPQCTLRWPAVLLETPLALACATAYAALAGFGLATLRTLLMIAAVALARLARRHLGLGQSLALAMAAMLLADPLALLSAGFWLSYAGVALLLYCLDSSRERSAWSELVHAQGTMSLGLLPLSVWLFGQSSVVGPLANLVAVPWISFVAVPLTLAGALLILPLPFAGCFFLQLAAWALEWQWLLLQWLAQWPLAQWHFAESSVAALLLAGLAVFWLLLPRGMPLRGLGLLLLLPLLWPRTTAVQPGEFEVFVIDVGQGLAVLLRTREHALLYDAGARYPSGFDLGEAVVVPAAQALDLRRLDRLVLSHADMDHAGGAAAVQRALQPRTLLVGDAALPAAPTCEAGQQWNWDGVEFRVLHPDAATPRQGNDASCVLLVQSGQARLLLTGDISAAVEPAVAAAAGRAPLVLLVPHHGSKTSSSAALLDALSVQLALVSAGYRNRFGHPHPAVAERYRARGIRMLGTAESGCIRMIFSPAAAPRLLEQCRLARRRYWTE